MSLFRKVKAISKWLIMGEEYGGEKAASNMTFIVMGKLSEKDQIKHL